MTMYVLFLNVVTTIIIVSSSIVKDIYWDKNKIIEEYCPKSDVCDEGTHVMCMYYDPRQRMGKQCHEAKDIQIRPEEAARLLELSNIIRGNVARGKETVRNGELLPRGYGMYRLEWDEELASFAQVLANQCLLKHDLCRGSHRFPNPGQTSGIVRFTYPNWLSVTGTEVFTPGLSDQKLDYSIGHIMQSWYSQKNLVTTDMIRSYPDWSQNLDKVGGKMYLDIIAGDATHMGCGISAYAEYAYHANNADLVYNNVQVVCNFSSRPRKGERVYKTDPPTDDDIGYTVLCGCPVGYDEDYNCLCYPSDRGLPKTCDSDKCKPSVVLLPIFTFEDAPAHKMLHAQGPSNNTLNLQDSFEILNNFDQFHGNLRGGLSNFKLVDLPSKVNENISRSFEHKRADVKRRYFGKPNNISQHYTISPENMAIRIKPKKTRNSKSIFTRVATFMLPSRKKEKTTLMPVLIKKDVVPRKDFSKIRKLVTKYLSRKSNDKDQENTSNISFPYQETTETHIKTTIQLYNNLRYMNDKKFDYDNVTQKSVSTQNNKYDKNVINLLDDLNTEIKSIDFDRNEREIFDAKIKQIYNSLSKFSNDRNVHSIFNFKNGSLSSYPSLNRHSLKETEIEDTYNRKFDDNSFLTYPNYKTENVNRMSNGKYRNLYDIRRKNKGIYKQKNRDVRRNLYLKQENVGEPLSNDRRKFYQDKLDMLERKLQNMRNSYKRQTVREDLRPMRPATPVEKRPMEQKHDFYLPDRARFLHGF